ncbi:MAG: UvrD-helicase domain-containing protein [Candidatus Zixiibacteriota bacterium]|nr:MAG: UvrD-helicase domain-containing protein [candidate division Zixibacteria bacterium]
MEPAYLKGLNPPQKEAVTHIEGPLLILAGAGSGKTRVITHRIAHIIAREAAKPNQILAVTFTNKAAGEMKDRVAALLGPEARRVWLSTFHSFCARVLREYSDSLGFKRSFSIYDESESIALIKRIYKYLGIPEAQPPPPAARTRISRAKDRLITGENFASQANDFLEENISKVYEEYQKRLFKNQAMDFDDLLMKTVELFEKESTVLRYMQNRFKYILIDEYQDTNHAQYRLVNLLAKESRNICVVGDDDQSIYGWRGADINNILDFEKDYPEAKIIKLEQNYRSTQNILDAAGDVVTKIPGRKSKKLFTDKIEGEKISLLLCGDEVDEAESITEKVRLGMVNDKAASDFAVLYRTNAQSRVLEDSLRYKGIPYTIVGGIKFYERAEVKDILAYLRILVNPADDLALRRIINVPKRGVGKTSVEKLERLADEKGQSLMSVLISSLDESGIGGKARKELDKFVSIMDGLSSKVDELTPNDIAARLIERIRYLEILYDEGTPEADVRADNVKELVAGIAEYTERSESPTLAGFLEEVALITDIDTWDDSTPSVTLMTLHSAKGLEFDTVFISGMEDGLFPLQRNFGDSSDPDEERRLCYVGITRAKNKLYLSMAGFRRRWGDYTGGPSVFLRDIPESLLEVERFNYWNDYGAAAKNSYNRRSSYTKRKGYELELEDFDIDEMLPEGTKVLHDKFGQGIIVSREGGGEELMITVRFERYGNKTLMARYANLEIIGR